MAERGKKIALRAKLAKLLSGRSDTLIMLSATPHDGRAQSFASLMNMLDPTAIANPEDYGPDDIKGLFIRRFKKDIQDRDHGFGWTGKNRDERLVIFAERIETLHFLYLHLPKDLGLKQSQAAFLHGGMPDVDQQAVVEQFGQENAPVRLLTEVLKMLKKEGKINDAVIENMLSWRHSGFHVYIGDRITPSDNPRSHVKPVLATWPVTLSGPVFHRREWSMFQLKTQQMVLPKLFTHPKTGSPGKFLQHWTGWPD